MKRQTKRKLLITLNWMAAVICLISLCCVDSRNFVFAIINATSFGWLVLSGLANGLIGGEN